MNDLSKRILRNLIRVSDLVDLHGSNLPRPVEKEILRLVHMDRDALLAQRDRLAAALIAVRRRRGLPV